jgi:hypothetical protein
MMTEVEKLLAECSDICKIVDKKTFSSKANTAELIDELLRFVLELNSSSSFISPSLSIKTKYINLILYICIFKE